MTTIPNNQRYLPHDLNTKYHSCKLYATKQYSVTFICRRYKISKSSLMRWMKRYDGSKESLIDRYHKPLSKHPTAHTVEVEKDIYAHNSFALTANGSPLIEPLQVSVKIPGKETEVPPKETPEKPPVEPPTPEEPPVEPPTPEEPPTDLPQTGFSNNNLFVGMFFLFSGLILNIRNKKQHKIN